MIRLARLLTLVVVVSTAQAAFAAEGDACAVNADCGTEMVCRDEHCALPRKNLTVPYLLGVYRRDDQKGTRSIVNFAPPFVHHKSPTEEVISIPPIFMRTKKHATGETKLMFGPLVHQSSPTKTITGLFPLLWRMRDDATDTTAYAAFPIFGFRRSPTARAAFVGPFFGWSTAAGDFGTGVAPVLFFGKRGSRTHAVLAPLFGVFHDPERGEKTVFVGPIVHRTTPDGTLDVVPPVFAYRGKRGYSVGVFPILKFEKLDGKQRQAILPIYYRAVDPDGTSRLWLMPYYRAREGAVKTDAFLPLFFYKRSPERSLFVSVLGGYKREGDRERMMFGPFVWHRDPKKKTSTRAIVPFAIVHRSPNWDVTGAIPFVWRVRDGQDVSTTVFPLYWRSRGPETNYDVLFPIAAHVRTKAATTTIAGPFAYRRGNNGSRTAILLPLFGYHKGAPGKSSFFISPIVQRQSNEALGIDRTLALPFFRFANRDGYTAGLIPLAFAWRRGTSSKFISPLFYRQADTATHQDESVFTIFYWGKKGNLRRGGMFPLVFVTKEAGVGTRATVLPFGHFGTHPTGSFAYTVPFGYKKYDGGWWFYAGLAYGRRDRDVQAGALWPLVYHFHRKSTGDATTMVLPFYLNVHRGSGKDFKAFTPLAYRYRTIESATTLVLPPIFTDHHRFGEQRTTSLFPIYLRHRSEVKNSTEHVVLPLLFWTRSRPNEGARDAVFFPLVWRFGGRDRSSTVVFPLVWDFKRPDRRTTVVFPVFARWTRPNNVHTLVLNTYYRKGRGPNDGTYHFNFIPLFDFGRPRRGDISWHILEGLVGYSRQGRNRFFHLLWFIDIPLEPVPASNLTWFGSTPPEDRVTF